MISTQSTERVILLKNLRTGSYPMIYHDTSYPDKGSGCLPDFVRKIASLPPQKLGCPSDLSIVTWNNYRTPSILEKTCWHLGIPIKVYGKDTVWKTNYETKLSLMIEACEKETSQYILGIDSMDLLFTAAPNIILNEFKKMNIDMLFGATPGKNGFYKDAPDLSSFFNEIQEKSGSPFSSLNGGQWIAKRTAALEFFKKARVYPPRPEKPSSDQIILAHTLCHNREFDTRIKMDCSCAIFQVHTMKYPIISESHTRHQIFYTLYNAITLNGSLQKVLDPLCCLLYKMKLTRNEMHEFIDRQIGAVGIIIKRISPRTHSYIKQKISTKNV